MPTSFLASNARAVDSATAPYFTTGNVFYVSSTHADRANEAAGGTQKRPFSTLDYAVGQCTASNGDLIIVMPGHVETVTAAAGLDLDVVGITLLGIGRGANRPTINFTTAVGADMDVDAANITMENFLFTGGIDALTGPIDVNAADFSLLKCEYRDVTGQATDTIVTDANATRLLIQDYYHNGATAAGANAAVAIVGGDGIVIDRARFDGNFAVATLDIRTTATTDFELTNAFFRNRHASGLTVSDTVTGSTGRIGPNVYARQEVTGTGGNAASFTAATMVWFDPVTVTDTANLRGLQIKTAASDA